MTASQNSGNRIIGISGSTIYSVRESLADLFSFGLPHIEIGEFADEASLTDFLGLRSTADTSFGIHAPVFRENSKYDLLEFVYVDPVLAWQQFEADVAHMSALGADYILVHFPYFHSESELVNNSTIENGLDRLSLLQNKYNIQIVCEPKLGALRSSVGIEAMNNFPVERWAQSGVKLCIDIGDYLLACDDLAPAYIERWLDHILVVHLHNIEFQGSRYIWTPIHPSFENDGVHFRLEPIIRLLAGTDSIMRPFSMTHSTDDLPMKRYFILEHTPEIECSQSFITEGITWLQSIVNP